MTEKPTLAVIGGSGLYDIEGLKVTSEQDVDTPFGKPSAPILIGELTGTPLAFLARHGRGHPLSPGEVNYRANIYALKKIGVERVISVNACGSLREDYHPGDIVIPDQLFDFTKNRTTSFFEGGMVAHLSIAEPFCPDFSSHLLQAVQSTGAEVHAKGSFITIEGPRFSTRLESNTFRAWGMDIIGMTTSPEAFLAREAELCYSAVAHITDYDVWHKSEEPVTVDMVIQILNQNTEIIKQALQHLVQNPPLDRPCHCSEALKDALITDPTAIPDETRQKLDLLVSHYL